MECAYTFKIDQKDYPFHKFIDAKRELDTDELRHTIKPTIHVIAQDFKGEEHLFCDKEQRCPLGKYRRPKVLVEAEKRGFATGLEMVEADQASQKKAEEDKKVKEADDLKNKLEKSQQDFDDYKALTEERFNKLVALIQK